MNINHPKVKKLLRQCERKIMKMTGKAPVSIFILNSYPATIPYEDIERIVCEVMGFTVQHIKSNANSRITEYKTVRQLLCFYARHYTSLTLRSIGACIGGHHYSTVIHSVDRIKGLIESDDADISRYVKEINVRIAQLKASQI